VTRSKIWIAKLPDISASFLPIWPLKLFGFCTKRMRWRSIFHCVDSKVWYDVENFIQVFVKLMISPVGRKEQSFVEDRILEFVV